MSVICPEITIVVTNFNKSFHDILVAVTLNYTTYPEPQQQLLGVRCNDCRKLRLSR